MVDENAPAPVWGPYLEALSGQGIPHLARTRIAPLSAGAYRVSQQIGLYTPETEVLYPREQLRACSCELPLLAEAYDWAAITSTRQLLTTHPWRDPQSPTDAIRPLPRRYESPAVHTARTIACGPEEYAWLLGTAAEPTALSNQYRTLEYAPTLTISRRDLPRVLGYPVSYRSGQAIWARHPGRECPHLSPQTQHRSATGTTTRETDK